MRTRTMLWVGLTCLAVALAIGALVVAFPDASTPDRWWNQLMIAERAPWMISAALVLDSIGGGWVAVYLIPLSVIGVLVAVRRWRAAVFAAAAFVASALGVQLLKQLFGRARPEDMLVMSDYGSFPSGHTANAATIALVFWLLFPRRGVAVIGAVWVVLMGLSRTALSVHWASDTVGGALIGCSAALLVGAAALPWVRRHAPVRVREGAGDLGASSSEVSDDADPPVSS